MKLALVILGIIALPCMAFEIVCRIGSRHEKERFDRMSPEERFRYQNEMRKAEL